MAKSVHEAGDLCDLNDLAGGLPAGSSLPTVSLLVRASFGCRRSVADPLQHLM